MTGITYSLQINGHNFGLIKNSRGLMQGDPLNPYLHLFFAVGLSHLIKNSTLNGLTISRRGPVVSHLLFTDDSNIFAKLPMMMLFSLIELLDYFSYKWSIYQQV